MPAPWKLRQHPPLLNGLVVPKGVKIQIRELAVARGPAASAHEWIETGALALHNTARCARCGVVRRYQSTLAGDSVRYSQYEVVLASGPREAVEAPACYRASRSVETERWDVLSA